MKNLEYVFQNYDKIKWSHSGTDIKLQSVDSNENDEEDEEENNSEDSPGLISVANITSEYLEKSNKDSSTKSHLFESKIINEDSKEISPLLCPNIPQINKKKEFRGNKKEKEGTVVVLGKINKSDSEPDLLKKFNEGRRVICPDLRKRRDYLGVNLFDFGFEKPKEYNVFFPKDNLNNVMKKLQKFMRVREKKKRKNR